jgi:hypothetical protein
MLYPTELPTIKKPHLSVKLLREPDWNLFKPVTGGIKNFTKD